jgi:hypothetical protein
VANRIDPKKIGFLALLLVVLSVLVVYRLRPALEEGMGVSSARLAQVGRYTVPSLGWERGKPREVPTPTAGRNLFTFGAPPTPTPDRRPTPTPVPPPPPPPTPTPDGIYVNGKWILPPPPQFPLNYLGWLGTEQLRVAVFRDGEDVLAVPVGDTVKQKFVVREVGPTAVTVGFVGYPENVTTKVPLAR